MNDEKNEDVKVLPNKEWLRADEVAEYIRKKKKTVLRKIEEGVIPPEAVKYPFGTRQPLIKRSVVLKEFSD